MLQPGDRFGDYTVVRLLGKGGMGSVFLLKTAEGAQVAAKILDPGTAGDHESRRRFVREAELALGVKHPNLVETYDVGEDPDTGLCYILMEYVPGGSLADRLKAGPLPISDAIRIAYQIASVLELARQKGIVHRDIKPANIMFGADGQAKLADLGIARGGSLGTNTTTVTQTGMMIGTPAYMAPEQMLDAHNVDCRADIYSLGVVFYEMLTGERPNKDDTVVQLMAKAVAGEPLPDVRTLRPEVSASLAELVSLMCAMRADARVATPFEVAAALSQVAHGQEVSILRKTHVAAGKSGKHVRFLKDKLSRRIAVGSGLTVAVTAVVLLAAWPRQSPSRSPERPLVKPIAVPQTVVVTEVVEKVVSPPPIRPEPPRPAKTAMVERGPSTNMPKADGGGHVVPDRLPTVRRRPAFAMGFREESFAWLDEAERESLPIRVCLDLSHGGFPSMTQVFYADWLKAPSFDFRQKPCWHDLKTENLVPVNVLVLPATTAQVLYDEKECELVDGFLRSGGTVVAISGFGGRSEWAMGKFLSRYGLEVFALDGNVHPTTEQKKRMVPAVSPCRAFKDLNMSLSPLVYAAPSSEEGRDAWLPLALDKEDGNPLMAVRSVGGGRLIWSSSWYYKTETGDLHKLWTRLFAAAACAKRVSPERALGERPITDAPLVRRVGPIAIYASSRWQTHVEALARMVDLGLPRLEAACGRVLDPEIMATTKFVLTGTDIWGWLPQGEKTIVTSATFRGFPDRLVYLSTFVFRMMLSNALPSPPTMRYADYVALRAFCDLGYPNEMDAGIDEGRKKNPDFTRFRFKSGRLVDGKGGQPVPDPNGFIAKAKLFSAYEEFRQKVPDFVVLCAHQLKRLGHVPTEAEFAEALSMVTGMDAWEVFGRYGVVVDRSGAQTAAGAQKVADARVSPERKVAEDFDWEHHFSFTVPMVAALVKMRTRADVLEKIDEKAGELKESHKRIRSLAAGVLTADSVFNAGMVMTRLENEIVRFRSLKSSPTAKCRLEHWEEQLEIVEVAEGKVRLLEWLRGKVGNGPAHDRLEKMSWFAKKDLEVQKKRLRRLKKQAGVVF